jgi:hypothetical protein
MVMHLLVYRAVLIVGILAALTGNPLLPLTSERDVLEKFCELDAKGSQLNVESRKELSSLFTQPAHSRPETAIIIKDFVVLGSSKVGDGAEFEVEYVYLERLNLSLARYSRLPSSYPPGPVKVRVSYSLVHTSTHSASDTSSTVSSESRIKGGPPEPHITIETAIRYLTELKGQSSEVDIKKSADKAIAALQRLQ